MGIASLGRVAAHKQRVTGRASVHPADVGAPAVVFTHERAEGIEGGEAQRKDRTGQEHDSTPQTTALEQLTQYIPTETVTLFIAAVAARQVLTEGGSATWLTPGVLIFIFAVITPVMLWLVALAVFREDQRADKIPKEEKFKYPIFDMTAATIAFVIWSFAVPGLFDSDPIIQVLAGFAALVASWVLSIIARIIGT